MTLSDSTAEKLRKQTIKSLIDVIFLSELKNQVMSGYDLISYVHNTFAVLLSSGTVYSHLYSLERDGLIVGKYENKKRVYHITEKGIKLVTKLAKTNLEMLNSLQTVLNQ